MESKAASPSRPPDHEADGGTQSPFAAGLRPALPSVHESPVPQRRRPAGRPAWQPGCATVGRFCTPARAGLRGLPLRALAAARPSRTPDTAAAPTGSAREAAAALGSTLKRLAFRDASPTVAARGGEAAAATPVGHSSAGNGALVGVAGRHRGPLGQPGNGGPSSLRAQLEAMRHERDAGLARLKRELVEARGRAAREARREREARKLARLERAVADAGRESHPLAALGATGSG